MPVHVLRRKVWMASAGSWWPVLLLLVCGGAVAQQSGAPPAAPPTQAPQPAVAASEPVVAGTSTQATPAAQERLRRQDQEMGRAALQVAVLVDEDRIAEVWDGASRVARETVAREAFQRQVSQDRTRLGALQGREQVAVNRASYAAGGQVPEGTYISVVFSSRFENVPDPVRELVSFRLDEDRSWRVTGYSLR